MIDQPEDVIDLGRAMTRRLQRKAAPIGIEVKATATAFALYGPDLGVYLYPRGVGPDVLWLGYEEASRVLERHITARMSSR